MENSIKLQCLSKALRHSNYSHIEKAIIELIQENMDILIKYDIPFQDAWDTWQRKANHKKYT